MYIYLTQGEKVKVDDEDYISLNQYKWTGTGAKKYRYAIRTITINKKLYQVRMHRIIMHAPTELIIDHINGDTLDNRKSNLRIVTYQQNSSNVRLYSHNKSGYAGVSWNSKKITNKGNRKHKKEYFFIT